MASAEANPTPIEAVKQTAKAAAAFARESKWDEFFGAYTWLFQFPSFEQNKPEDQRQALKLMILTKGLPPPTTQHGVAAYQAAWYVLTRLMGEHQPTMLDYLLLGLTHLRLADEPGAKKLFDTGYAMAQDANDGDMCGEFLRYLSTI